MSARSRIVLVALTAGGLAAGCSGSSTGPESTTAPALLSVVPQGGATNVSRANPLVVHFSGGMAQGMEQYVDLHRGDMAGPLHSMTCTWSADRQTVSCVPGTPMDPQTQYALHLGGGMKGGNGAMATMGQATQMGGQSVTTGMGNGMHAGQSMSMMGSGWMGSNGSYGMMFSFRTGN